MVGRNRRIEWYLNALACIIGETFPTIARTPSSRGRQCGAEQRARGYRGRRRYGNLAARRPGVARADGAEPPWRDRGGCKRAGATLLQYAADGTHDADISGAAA